MARGAPGASYTLRIDGLQSCLDRFQTLEGELRRQANGDLREVAVGVAREMVPVVSRIVASGGAPQSGKVADTVRAKKDRKPLVRVGAVNPKLSGFGRSRAGNARHKGSVAFGVEYGPGGGHRPRPSPYGKAGSRGGNAQGADFYPGANQPLGRREQMMLQAFTDAYTHELSVVMRRWGLI